MTNRPKKTAEALAHEMRLTALAMAYKCGEPCHIGGGLSIIDILATLYKNVMVNPGTKDRFILSKGHGVLGLYSALFHMGYLTQSQIDTFQTNGSKLIAHPIMDLDAGIESSNGSLGQGLSMGVGIAIAYKRLRKSGNVYILMGDGECYEGSVWEAAISATEHKLSNLTIIIDSNGFQNDGEISDCMNAKNLSKKWRGFGWDTSICNGHNIDDLTRQVNIKCRHTPRAIVAKTKKGFGVPFMEDNNDWHHNRLSQKLYEQAIKECGQK
ncbi:transketolase [Alphaproteobacteria bacterium]|nr:transketolase [Alphaproteobacteria bacterium]